MSMYVEYESILKSTTDNTDTAAYWKDRGALDIEGRSEFQQRSNKEEIGFQTVLGFDFGTNH